MCLSYLKSSIFFLGVALTSALSAGNSSFVLEKSAEYSPEQIFSKGFTAVAKQATPAVVFIKVQGVSADQEEGLYNENPYDFFNDDFFNRFFGITPKKQPKQAQVSQGSGFFVSSDGYIMTNAHVVKGADKMIVVLHDGREMDAILVGLDTHTDIAIIKLEGKDFPYLAFGNSDAMEIGEWVVAIGSPFQLEASLTAGVISAKGRQNLRITDLEDFIQTDAAINPGNSGGPLLNLKSQVTAIVSRTGGYMGIGFAIPSNMAKNIMHQIIDKGSVTRGFIGVTLQPLDKDLADAFNLEKPEGALITEVVKDSPADKAGLKQGDIIIEYNGISIKTIGTFRNEISLMNPGTKVKLKVNRGGKILTLVVVLTSHSDMNAGMGGYVPQKLGFEVENLNPELAKQLGFAPYEKGVVVTKVKPGSAAALAGIRPGFLLLAVNHEPVSNIDDFIAALQKAPTKNHVLIVAKQGNMTRFYSLKID
jgi:serine protease Do